MIQFNVDYSMYSRGIGCFQKSYQITEPTMNTVSVHIESIVFSILVCMLLHNVGTITTALRPRRLSICSIIFMCTYYFSFVFLSNLAFIRFTSIIVHYFIHVFSAHRTVHVCKTLFDLYRTLLYRTLLYSTELYTLLYRTLLYSAIFYSTVLYCTLLYRTLLYSTVLYCTLPYCTLLYSTVLYCTLPYSTVLYRTLLYSTVLYSTVLCRTLLYSAVLYSTVLYCTLLYYTTLFYSNTPFYSSRNNEGEEQLRQRRLQLPFNFATGEAVLYEVGLSLDVADVPTQSKGPKIRKMAEEMALDPDSLLGSMLKQDQAIYMQTSPSEPSSKPPNPQELCSWEDQAFSNSHAMANVPGDSWQSQHHTMPRPDAGIREESTVQDLMETLQQIIGDNSLCSSLNVDPTELKDWENTLLKMSSSNCEMSEDLDDILNHDILSYVEEHLFKENGGLKMPEHLGSLLGSVSINNPLLEVPECLKNVDLQGNTMMPGGKGFNWGVDPQQNQLLGMGGLSAAETASNVRGMMKLTHVGSQMGLNGPTLQQASSRNTFTQSLGENLGLQSNANPLAFNPALAGSCAQVRQNQAKGKQQGLQASQILSNPGNGLASYSQRQQMQSGLANRSSAPMGLPIQNQLLGWGMNDQPMRFQDQRSISQSDPFAVPGQETMWMPLPSSMPNTNMVANTLLETFAQNFSNQPKDVILDPNPASCLQGHFSLQTQKQQQQQMLPTMLHQQNGHQHNVTGSFYNNQVSDFQIAPQLPIPGLEAQSQQNSQAQNYNRAQTISGQYRPQKTSAQVTPPLVSSNSCMFSSTNPPSVPVNGVCLNPNTALGSLVPSSCQRATAPLHDQSPSQASCYFQRNSSGSIVGSSAILQGDTNISPLSCQVGPGLTPGGLTPDSLLVQQQYLNCNRQTQVTNCPMEENISFQFPPLPNGTTYFSENNQNNCCDF
uniref:Uncharacterized protein n=1 Tax=Oncorhynchus kisutch TaxID=8019 RepID=A0A8C7F3R0_ONCKI